MKSGFSPAASARARSARTRRPCDEELVEDALLLGVVHGADARLAELGGQRFVARQRLFDLERVVGEELRGGIDAGQAAADHDGGQARLQIRQRIPLERAGELQRHQEVAGLADAANQVVLDVDDRRAARAGRDRDVIDAESPRVFDRQRAAEADAAVDAELVTARQRQVNQREEVLVPAHRDAVLGHTAEALEHAVVERTVDLAPVCESVEARDRIRRSGRPPAARS